MRLLDLLFLGALGVLNHANALNSYPLRPPAFPLSVRSPYLSTWIDGNHDGITGISAKYWHGDPVGWNALVRVEDQVWSLFGDIEGYPLASQLSQSFTASTTNFRFAIQNLIVELVFNNAVTPHNYKRQSIPISYVEVIFSAVKNDDVQLYFEVTPSWLSDESNTPITWEDPADSREDDRMLVHRIQRKKQIRLSEANEYAEWGSLIWATDRSHSTTYAAGHSAHLTRRSFAKRGFLQNTTLDLSLDSIKEHARAFSFAKSLKASREPQSVLFTTGFIQADAVLELNLRGKSESVPGFWSRYFSTTHDMISWHYSDYASAKLDAFGSTTTAHARSIDSNLASIVTLSVSQVMGSAQLVINPQDIEGEPLLFMKETSSSGNVQTVDVIFPTFPFFLYANPRLMIALLRPLLKHQQNRLYPHKYSMHDLGASWPRANGHSDGQDEYMPVEECGNMLIMMLATYQALSMSADRADLQLAESFLMEHYDLLLQWSEYLLKFGLITEFQYSTDDFAGRLANQTNLAVKAIIGIKAMAEIALLCDDKTSALRLNLISQDYSQKWQSMSYSDGISFAKLAYQWNGSWGTLYNLYADKLLGLNVFPQSVYDAQEAWYHKVLEPCGLPLDSRHTWAKSDWQMFIAAISGSELSTEIYARMASYFNSTKSTRPMMDLYDAQTGSDADGIIFTARPVVGGHFAPLYLQKVEEYRRHHRGHGDDDSYDRKDSL